MRCFNFLWCITTINETTKKTVYASRWRRPFIGPIYPFGCEIRYKPSNPKDKKRLHKYGDKMLPGLMAGYAVHPGGDWNEDLCIIDKVQLFTAPKPSKVYLKRIHHKEVYPMQQNGKFKFPVAERSWYGQPSDSAK